MDETIKNQKTVAFRADPKVVDKFDDFLRKVRESTGEKVLKEDALQFLMDYCAEMKPKDFLKALYAYKAGKFD